MKTKIYLLDGIYYANIESLGNSETTPIIVGKKEFFEMLKKDLFGDISKDDEIPESRFYKEVLPAVQDLSEILARLEALEAENKALKANTKKIDLEAAAYALNIIYEKRELINVFSDTYNRLEVFEVSEEALRNSKLVFASAYINAPKKEISISNSFVISKFLQMLKTEILAKIESLKAEISEIEEGF